MNVAQNIHQSILFNSLNSSVNLDFQNSNSLTQRFLFRKRSSLTCSGVMQLLFAVMISPAVENTLSDATLVPGTQRQCPARRATSGSSPSRDLHQVKGLSFREAGGSALYLVISSSARLDGVFLPSACTDGALQACPKRDQLNQLKHDP